MNVPWIASDVHTAPCSKLDDGKNDIVFMAEGASRIQLTKFLLAMETGDFFNKRTGLINQSLGL